LPLEAEGEFALVRKILEPTLAVPAEWIGDHDLYAMLADVAARQRDEAALRIYAPQAEAWAKSCDHMLYSAMALRAWGVLHRLKDECESAALCLTQGLALFRELGARWQVGRTLFELGELATAQASPQVARDYYGEALSAFEEMGASPDVARVRDVLAALEPM